MNNRTYLGAGVASVLIALIILVVGCFAALTYMSANTQAEMAAKSEKYCNNYYAAETVASKLLDSISSGSGRNSSPQTGEKTEYDTDLGTVVVTRADKYVSFKVPIGSTQELSVEANVTKKEIQIITWSVE